MFCSNCGGANLRKLSLVHEMGLTFVNGTSSGVGVGAGRVASGSASVPYVREERIRRRLPCAPRPPRRNDLGGRLYSRRFVGLAISVWVVVVADADQRGGDLASDQFQPKPMAETVRAVGRRIPLRAMRHDGFAGGRCAEDRKFRASADRGNDRHAGYSATAARSWIEGRDGRHHDHAREPRRVLDA